MSDQQEFDRIYATSGELCKELSIDRSTLCMGRKRGKLPEPVKVNGDQILIWKRDAIRDSVDAWKRELEVRRGTYST